MNSTVAWVVFGGIFLLAFALRVVNLGGPDFGIDEILHVYAAKGLIEEGSPVLPNGTLYSRALVYTKLVALVGEFWEINEWTARVPSVFWGLLTVLLTFIIGRSWYSAGVGLVAAFLVAVIPAEIVFSRSVRMYSMFQFFYLAIIFLFFCGFESCDDTERSDGRTEKKFKLWNTLEIRPVVLVITGFLFLFTVQVHVLVAPGMAGPLLYIFFMACMSFWLSRVSIGCKFKYGISVLLIGIVALGIYVINEDWVEQQFRVARFVPVWAQHENVDNWWYYRDSLALRYPIVFGTFLFGGLLGLARRPKLTTYLLACFVAPLLLSSILFSWKAYRYIFHLLPLLFILFSIGFCELFTHLYRALVDVCEKEVNQRVARGLAAILIVVGVVFSLESTTWFNQGVRYHSLNVSHVDGVRYNSWNEAMRCVSRNSTSSDVLVTPWPLLSKYYGPERKLYLFNDVIPPEANIQFLDEATGIKDLEALQSVVRKNPSGLFVSDRARFFHFPPSIPIEVRDWVSRNFTEIHCSSAADMVIWKWEERE